MDSGKYLLFLSLTTLLFLPSSTTATRDITAIYAFGDSILDSGNNNDLATLCRSNHPPYGIDFPGRIPSGRFTDGKLPMDFVISHLGIKDLLPAYLDPAVTDEALLTGASFASSCTGLDDLTAAESGVLSMTTQFMHFHKAFQRIRGLVGLEEAGRIVEKAVFVIAAGTSDMLDNFYGLRLRRMYSLAGYHDLLLKNLEVAIKRLHSMGATRLAVMGMPPVGCLPKEVTAGSLNPGGHIIKRVCFAEHNLDSQAYNAKLQALIKKFQVTLPGAKVVYVDIYSPIIDMIHEPAKFGLERTLEGCCGSGSLEAGPLCNLHSPTCPDPSKFLFWDAAHLTQAAYKILAKRFLEYVLPDLIS